MDELYKQILGLQMPEIDWKHLKRDSENIWITKNSEGFGTKYILAVHYFQTEEKITWPYVMVNLETRPPGTFVFDGGSRQFSYFFFDPEGNGQFVGAEGDYFGEPSFRKIYYDDKLKVEGAWDQDYTMQVREQLKRIPDSSVVESIDGFFKDEKGLPEEEVKRIYEGEKSLVHRYNKDSLFYKTLAEKETEADEFMFFSFHRELGRQLAYQLKQFEQA